MDSDSPIIGYCIYCKLPIYLGEFFVKKDNNIYHSQETEEHDNCYNLIKQIEEE